MKPLLRWTAYFIGALLVLSIIFSVAVMILIDPNDYKEDIASAVAEETGRAFSIEGDLALKTFPCCGIRLGPLALGNPPGFPEGDFASVETAAVSLQLWPLIVSQELRIGEVELTGFDVRLISRADGTNNWGFGAAADAPVAEEETAAPGGGLADLNISGIVISAGRLSYLDEAVGDPIVISDINFSTSAIVAGEPFDLEASLLADGLAPGVSASINMEARGLIDAALPALDLSDLRGEIAVAGDDLPGGSVKLNLGLEAARGLGTEHVPLEGLSAGIELAGLNLNISGGGALVDNNPDLAGTIAIQRFSPRE
jgi:AsmA protein